MTYRLEKGSELTHEEMDANFRTLERGLIVKPIVQNENGVIPLLDARDVQAPSDGTKNLALLFIKIEGLEITKATDSTEDIEASSYTGFGWSDGYYSAETPSVFDDKKLAILFHIDADGKATIASDDAGLGYMSNLEFVEIEDGLFGVKPVEDGKLAVGTITVSTLEFVDIYELGAKVLP